MSAIDFFLFGIYPYVCLAVFFVGSLIRFDRDQYTWKSDSSQLLRGSSLRMANNLFHVGVLFLFFGHFVGMLTPHFVYERFVDAGTKQLLAMIAGGIAGTLGLLGVSLLLYRRLGDSRIRAVSKTSDIFLLWLFWAQLALGLATIPLSSHHLDGSVMLVLADWAQRIVTMRAGAVDSIGNVDWVFKMHMVLGMTVFLVFPFTRLVHVWSGFASLAYLVRPYQVVRSRRLNAPDYRRAPAPSGAKPVPHREHAGARGGVRPMPAPSLTTMQRSGRQA